MSCIQKMDLASGQRDLAEHHVMIDLSTFAERSVNLFFSWTELWLKRNCKSGWFIEVVQDYDRHTILKVSFQDQREAVFFKLSPQYDLASYRASFFSSFIHLAFRSVIVP